MDPIFNYGELIRITAAFLTSTGSMTIDPSTVKGQYHARALGITTTYTYPTSPELVRGGSGNYYFDIDTNESSGVYNWKIFSTGSGQASAEGKFYIRPQQFS